MRNYKVTFHKPRGMFRRIFTNTGYLFSSQLIFNSLYLIRLLFIARILGLSNFGILAFIFVFKDTFFLLLDLGLTKLTIREVARKKSEVDNYLNNLTIIKLLIGFFALPIIIFGSYYIFPDNILKIGIPLACFFVIIDSLNSIFKSIFRAFEKMKYEAFLVILESFVTVSISILFLLSGFKVISIVIANGMGIIIAFFFGIWIIKRYVKFKFEFKPDFCFKIIKKGLPFISYFFIMLLSFKINVIMLYFFKKEVAVGIYVASSGIIYYLFMFPYFFTISVFPSLSKLYIKSKIKLKEVYSRSFNYLFILSLIIVLSLIIFSKYIIVLIYGKEFINSIAVLKMLSIAAFFMYLTTVNTSFLDAVNKPHINAYIGLIGLILNIFLNLLLIPKFSYFGAVVAAIITVFILFVIKQLYITNNYIKINRHQ